MSAARRSPRFNSPQTATSGSAAESLSATQNGLLAPPQKVVSPPNGTQKNSGKRKSDTVEIPSASAVALKKPKLTHPPYTKHVKFWALDGNTLLQVNKTRYRVQRSRLAAHSPWFEKLFERRSGKELDPEDEDTADINDVVIAEAEGLDLYNLDSTGVTNGDFEQLLEAMDNAIDFYFNPPTFHTASGLFRASSMFSMTKFKEFTSAYLEDMFPPTLYTVTTSQVSHAAEAIVLGRQWDLKTILKRAFDELVRAPDFSSVGESVAGDVCGDENLEGDGSDGDSDDDSPEDPMHKIERKDLVRLATLQKLLMTEWMTTVFDLPRFKCPVPNDPCLGSRPGSKSQYIIHSSGVLTTSRFDPICGLQQLINLDWTTKGYCPHCARQRVQGLAMKREQIWERIDQYLELEYS